MNKLSLLIIAFVALLSLNSVSSREKSQTVNSGDSAVCLVSGEPIEAGKGINVSYLGKEYTFCCEGCVSEFKAASIKYTGGVATCPICNHDDGSESISTTYEGITYYFCANGCKEKFEKNPEKVLEQYNKQ